MEEQYVTYLSIQVQLSFTRKHVKGLGKIMPFSEATLFPIDLYVEVILSLDFSCLLTNCFSNLAFQCVITDLWMDGCTNDTLPILFLAGS